MSDEPKEKYLCSECGHDEFATEPNRYDVFIAHAGQLYLQESLTLDEEIMLYCRACGMKRDFAEQDVIF